LCSVLRLTDSPNAVGTLSGRVWDSRGLGKLAEPTPSLIYEIETYDETGGGHQRASEEDLVLLVYMRVEYTGGGHQRASEEDFVLLVYFQGKRGFLESILEADTKELRRKI
jgi:hypothetical protein